MTVVFVVIAFAVGCLVGANNPLTTKMIANRLKAQAQETVQKVQDQVKQ